MSAVNETWEAWDDEVFNEGGDCEMVAEVVRTESWIVKRDDARMIAAAPDLARALREMCAAFLGSDILRRAAAYEQAERALAKAGVDTAGIVGLAREGVK